LSFGSAAPAAQLRAAATWFYFPPSFLLSQTMPQVLPK